MSNEYKEWYEDCKEQAWIDIGRIADLFDTDKLNDFDRFDKIKDILKEGGWI